MKNKYQRLNKEQKKIVKEAYKNDNDRNHNISVRLTRSMYLFILGIVYSIGMILYLLISKTGMWYEYVAFGFMLILCLVLSLKVYDYFSNILNKYVIEHKKDFSKKITDFEKI